MDMAKSETQQHRRLKALALQWALAHGYPCCAMEVSLPASGYRADVAAYKPARETRTIDFEGRKIRRSETVIGTTAVFECKQSRADLLKDSCISEKTSERLKRLNDRRVVLERLLKIHYPSAANGDSLFQEFQTYNFEAINHKGYQKVLCNISTLQTSLSRKTKFEKLARYRCANLFYLVTPKNILKNYELPLNWGLLVENGDELELVRKPMWLESTEGSLLGVLQRIAKSGTNFAVSCAGAGS